MRNTRLIFVEGIMGAGKSTKAEFLAGHLQRRHIDARFMLEGPTIDEPCHPLRVATDLPHPNGVWLDVTVDEYIERNISKWRAFAHEAQHSAVVTVCDGLLFHGNMTDLMLMDAAPPVLQSYVATVIESISALNPVVIYFYHADVAKALRAVCEARGSAWEAYQVNWKVASPYGVRRSLQGFAGLVELYCVYRAICDGIFAHLTLPKLAILNEGCWSEYYRAVLRFLEVETR